MKAKISVIVICVEAMKYLLLYILHDCTFDFFEIDIWNEHSDAISEK